LLFTDVRSNDGSKGTAAIAGNLPSRWITRNSLLGSRDLEIDLDPAPLARHLHAHSRAVGDRNNFP
jgi:hypothetical protein